ncbi:MAG: helix-turn-helix transcriptional regulator [Clostridia bacterium]|nr:helix-turn-helix transcriptional regulator [Clostridia bacterium]
MPPAQNSLLFASNPFHIPPMKYKKLLRLEKAHELLLSKEYSVKEVSNIVGYDDVSYFSKIFKKNYGYPPTKLLN